MAQALLCFLDNQYIELDGTEHKFVQGVMGIFGHGNVTGLGEALEYGDSSLSYIQGNNEQGLVHAATAFAKQKNCNEGEVLATAFGQLASSAVNRDTIG